MIVVEHRIRDIIATMPEIRINDTVSNNPFFHWGGKAELNRYLKAQAAGGTNPYPLIWLLPSNTIQSGRGRQATKTCEFIIATREPREELFNDQRYVQSFDTILNPTTDKLIQGLKKSSISTVLNEYETFNFPNYAENDKNFTIDLWDAIKLTIEVEFNDNCLKTDAIIYT